ncbi:MAG: hypothetical protein JSW61_11480 [Candidatus Thorarchaeota archaeon]|nr:MAG: hypothetical protein JSW61_11480 [Candidatus Thorarchaeota archaeon]
MTHTFRLGIDKIQPSQLYISEEKLALVMGLFEDGGENALEPVPVKLLNGEYVSTDGHTRLLAWYVSGAQDVEIVWEDTEMDWEAYAICVRWCKEEGITTAKDLKSRLVGPEQYQALWLDRCRVLQEELEAKRAQKA